MSDIVNIGFKLDTSQIEKGYKRLDKMGQVAEKTEGKLTKAAKGAKATGAAMATLGTAAIGATTAIAAMLYKLGSMERELQASARMAGLTTDQFEAMGFAYQQFGLTVEQVNDIYKDSRERIGEWLNSQSGALQDFGDAMGMSKGEITKFAQEVDGLNGQQLLQRMMDDLEGAGVSGNQLSGVFEAMASEATRMIPALENNGRAIDELSTEYIKFNAAFSLNEEDVERYATLNKNFDLFLDTATNGITKTLSPLAEVMGVLAMEATEFLSALQAGSVAAAQSSYADALEEQLKAREAYQDALDIPLAFGEDVVKQETEIATARLNAANESVAAADAQLEAAKKTAKAQLELNRTSTRNININLSGANGYGKDSETGKDKTFGDAFGGTDTVDLFALNQAKAYDQWIESISTTSTQIADLRNEIQKTEQAVLAGDLAGETGEEYIKDLESQIKALEVNPFESMTQGASDALSAMSGMFESGSKDAKKLAIAMQALNLVQAVGAVLNQGKGDPYTAFGRMAAMASMVASLGMSIGGLSGGLTDDSADNQANQNLNSWGEHSESIANSTDLVANSTEKLVGINTNMLEALKGLNLSITAAAGIAAKSITTPSINQDGLTFEYADISNIFEPLGIEKLVMDPLGLFGKAIDKLFGGESKVTDEGIRIMGGYITDLIDDVTIDAFQTVKYKKWKFGSTKNKTQFENVGDDVESQFSLVFESIANSVAVGAEMLGMSQSEIELAINSFELATQNLSLKGLDVDEKVEVINNYFSSVFNDLAIAVVPFLEDFQKAGEELGETLSRLATEVSVAEYLVDNFGVNFGDKMADPEAFAQAATNLAALAGGVEELAQQTSSFTNAFATDEQKFEIYSNAMEAALGGVGLSVPETTEGLFDLMASLDGTTEAGQKQIAALLGITDTASAYYKLLEDINEEMEAAANSGDIYRDAAKGLYEVTEATKAMSLDAALAAARLGDMSLAEELNLSNIGPSKDDFSSLIDYNIATAEAAAKLNELADLQEGKITVEDKQLTVLEEIRDKLTSDSNELQISELNSQMTNLNSIQSMQSRNIADSNALLQQMVIDGIPVRVES
ncbi:coil containing protein [Vibrio phage 1.127.O._10N.286.52.E12]|nr:coil containing protein [Vibrio phage 1.127.O._10N.286.52.E12]